jgi:DNA-binding transcriptional regulator PaaX
MGQMRAITPADPPQEEISSHAIPQKTIPMSIAKHAKLSAETRQTIRDGIIRFVAAGGFLTTALVLPNSSRIFDKSLAKLLHSLDERSRQRELHRTLYYLKQRGLITYASRDYEHGIRLTKAGRVFLRRLKFEDLTITKPASWDGHWRLVFFDIPEEDRLRRNQFDRQLRQLGFQMLQRSIWIHPYPCRREIEAVTEYLAVRKYVTYVEISQIDGDSALRHRFNHLLTT